MSDRDMEMGMSMETVVDGMDGMDSDMSGKRHGGGDG